MFWRKRKPSDFNAEIEAHLALEADRLKEQGLSEEEARMSARRAFGNVTQAQERFYESGRWVWWDQLCQDIRQGLRMLCKNPSFTVVGVLTLALGIGASTAIFTVISAVLLRPLPYKDPDRVELVYNKVPKWPGLRVNPSTADSLDWQAQNHVFSDLAILDWDIDPVLSREGEPGFCLPRQLALPKGPTSPRTS